MNQLNPESLKPVTQRDIDQLRCDVLNERLNPFAGDIYRSALTCFERFTALRGSILMINPGSNYLSGGLNSDGELILHIGTEQSTITPRIKSRIRERFGLPDRDDLPDGVYQLFVLAHEIGHVIQADPQFATIYGDYDDTVYNAQTEYEKYVYSENEVLADYIGAQIIANSALGEAIGLLPPPEEPRNWREWGERHRVDETLRLYGHVVYDIVHGE